jgi:hypothetical protein
MTVASFFSLLSIELLFGGVVLVAMQCWQLAVGRTPRNGG